MYEQRLFNTTNTLAQKDPNIKKAAKAIGSWKYD